MWEQRPLWYFAVPKKAVDGIKEALKPTDVEARRDAATAQAVPQGIVGLALEGAPALRARPKDEHVAAIHQGEHQSNDASCDREECHEAWAQNAYPHQPCQHGAADS